MGIDLFDDLCLKLSVVKYIVIFGSDIDPR